MARDPSRCPTCHGWAWWNPSERQWECEPCWTTWRNTAEQEREQNRHAREEAVQDAADRRRDAAGEATL